MQASQRTLVPDLDLNPPTSWSKPANALGLSNPLSHLPQSQQVQRLHQQIEHHRQLQRSTLKSGRSNKPRKSSGSVGGSSASTSVSQDKDSNNLDSGQDSHNEMFDNAMQTDHTLNVLGETSYQTNKNKRFNNNNNNSGSGSGSSGSNANKHALQFGADAQHINIRNSNDDDSDMSGGEDNNSSNNNNDDDAALGDRRSSSRGSNHSDTRGMYINFSNTNSNPNSYYRNGNSAAGQHVFHHHRSMSHGFGGLQGFTPFSPGSPISPSSHGSFASDGNSFSAPLFTPALLEQRNHSNNSNYGQEQGGGGHHHFSGGGPVNHGLSTSMGAVESPLASLAALSVISPTSSGPLLPLPTPRRTSTGNSGSFFSSSSESLSSFQSHGSSMIHPSLTMTRETSVSSSSPHQSGFTSALGQQLQLQRQQQQQQREQQQSQYQNQYDHQQQQQQQQQQQHSHQHAHQHSQQQSQEEEDYHRQSRSASVSSSLVLPPTRRTMPSRSPQTSQPRKYLGRQARRPQVNTIAKEVIEPTRRMAHILSEQKRREKINGGFDELKSVIPECADNTDSKATILRKAVDRIIELENEIRRYVDYYGIRREDDDDDQQQQEEND
ncbi:hypothetical protein BGZ98_001016 [Dissophora globulifera]|nr:hypothetical protein BGZ98_001016 [Dissophora globulifera]